MNPTVCAHAQDCLPKTYFDMERSDLTVSILHWPTQVPLEAPRLKNDYKQTYQDECTETPLRRFTKNARPEKAHASKAAAE